MKNKKNQLNDKKNFNPTARFEKLTYKKNDHQILANYYDKIKNTAPFENDSSAKLALLEDLTSHLIVIFCLTQRNIKGIDDVIEIANQFNIEELTSLNKYLWDKPVSFNEDAPTLDKAITLIDDIIDKKTQLKQLKDEINKAINEDKNGYYGKFDLDIDFTRSIDQNLKWFEEILDIKINNGKNNPNALMEKKEEKHSYHSKKNKVIKEISSMIFAYYRFRSEKQAKFITKVGHYLNLLNEMPDKDYDNNMYKSSDAYKGIENEINEAKFEIKMQHTYQSMNFYFYPESVINPNTGQERKVNFRRFQYDSNLELKNQVRSLATKLRIYPASRLICANVKIDKTDSNIYLLFKLDKYKNSFHYEDFKHRLYANFEEIKANSLTIKINDEDGDNIVLSRINKEGKNVGPYTDETTIQETIDDMYDEDYAENCLGVFYITLSIYTRNYQANKDVSEKTEYNRFFANSVKKEEDKKEVFNNSPTFSHK